MDIGARVLRVRTALALSQTEFGKRAGEVTKQAVSSWENNNSSPDWFSLEGMRNNMRINPEYIMLGKGESFISELEIELEAICTLLGEIGTQEILEFARFRLAKTSEEDSSKTT